MTVSASHTKRRRKQKSSSKEKESGEYHVKRKRHADSPVDKDYETTEKQDDEEAKWSPPRSYNTRTASLSALEAAASIVELSDNKVSIKEERKYDTDSADHDNEKSDDVDSQDGKHQTSYLYSLYWGESAKEDECYEPDLSPRSARRQRRETSRTKQPIQSYEVHSDKLVPQCLVEPIELSFQHKKRIVESHTIHWLQYCAVGQQFDHQIRTIVNAYYPCTYPTLLDDIIVAFILHRSEMTGVILNPFIDKLIHSNDEIDPRGQPLMVALASAFKMTYGNPSCHIDMDMWYDDHHHTSCLAILRMMIEKNTSVPKVLCSWISDCLNGANEFVLVRAIEKLLNDAIPLDGTSKEPLQQTSESMQQQLLLNWKISNPIEQLEALIAAEKSLLGSHPGRLISKVGDILLRYMSKQSITLDSDSIVNILETYFSLVSPEATQYLLHCIIQAEEVLPTGSLITLIGALDRMSPSKSTRIFRKHFFNPILVTFQDGNESAQFILSKVLLEYPQLLFGHAPQDDINQAIEEKNVMKAVEQFPVVIRTCEITKVGATSDELKDPRILSTNVDSITKNISLTIDSIFSLPPETRKSVFQLWGKAWSDRQNPKGIPWCYMNGLLKYSFGNQDIVESSLNIVIQPTLETYLHISVNCCTELTTNERLFNVLHYCLLQHHPTSRTLPVLLLLLRTIVHGVDREKLIVLFRKTFVVMISSLQLCDQSLDRVVAQACSEIPRGAWYSSSSATDPSLIAKRALEQLIQIISMQDAVSSFMTETLCNPGHFKVLTNLLTSRNFQIVVTTLDLLEKLFFQQKKESGTKVDIKEEKMHALWNRSSLQHIVDLLLRANNTSCILTQVRQFLSQMVTNRKLGVDVLWSIIIHLVKHPQRTIPDQSVLMIIVQLIGDIMTANSDVIVPTVNFIGRNLFIRSGDVELPSSDSIQMFINPFLLRILTKIADIGNLPIDLSVYQEALQDLTSSPVAVQVLQLDLLRSLLCYGSMSTHIGLGYILRNQRLKTNVARMANGVYCTSPTVLNMSKFVLQLYHIYSQ